MLYRRLSIMLYRTSRALSRYRVHVVTLIVLVIVASLLVLANLSFDIRGESGEPLRINGIIGHGYRQMSYGWPFVWRRHTLCFSMGPPGDIGWHYNKSRLAANLAVWLLLSGVSTGVCEWLLRRHQLRFCWNLKALLAAVTLAAMLCAWFSGAYNRANLQDKLIATIHGRAPRDFSYSESETVWMERRGWRWLDVVGADRFRQQIMAVVIGPASDEDDEPMKGDEADLQILTDLARLPSLRYLFFQDADCFTPAMADKLSRFPRLRFFSISVRRLRNDTGAALAALSNARRLRSLDFQGGDSGGDFERRAGECLMNIGKLKPLEELYLSSPIINGERLECLAGLTNLRRLSLTWLTYDSAETKSRPPLLKRLPRLPRLETLCLEDCDVDGRDLRYLTDLPCLRSITLDNTKLKAADMEELTRLECLEELAISDGSDSALVRAAAFASLRNLKHLKRLRIKGFVDKSSSRFFSSGPERDHLLYAPQSELDGCLRALDVLRQSKPDIVIESYKPGMGYSHIGELLPPERDTPAGIEHLINTMPTLPAAMSTAVWGSVDNLDW